MNLHGIVAPYVGTVNQLVPVVVLISVGQGPQKADGTPARLYATPGQVTASIGGTFTASIPDPIDNPTVLSIAAVLTGSLQAGDVVSGSDGANVLPFGTMVLTQLSGTPGGVGTYEIIQPATLNSCTVTSTSTALNITAVAAGVIQPGQALADGNAGTCTASATSNPAGAILMVTALGAGAPPIMVGDQVQGFDGANALLSTVTSQISGPTGGVGAYQLESAPDNGSLASGPVSYSMVQPGTTVTGQLSGVPGGIGLYSLSRAQTVAAETMTTSLTMLGQLQALSTKDLRQTEGLNLQGALRALYLSGDVGGVSRPQVKGGDLVTLPDGTTWLVTLVPEPWKTTAGWNKCIITAQNNS